jgi:fatty-acyl-CoA synthase
MAPHNYPLILKQVLTSGVHWVPEQEIHYRDQFHYTYQNMYQRVLQLAGALQKAGVKPGARVGVIEWDSHRYLEMYYAIPGTGAVLHTINPAWPLKTLAISSTMQKMISLSSTRTFSLSWKSCSLLCPPCGSLF